jgi:hypothetical protein
MRGIVRRDFNPVEAGESWKKSYRNYLNGGGRLAQHEH